MEFTAFAERAREIEATEADLEVVSLVADCLADAGDDLPHVARFLQGRVFPAWSSRTLDVGPSLCHEALARAASPNVGVEDVEDRLAEAGDVGEVAASLDLGGQAGLDAFAGGGSDAAGDGSSSGADDRTVGDVFDELDALAAAEGSGSEGRKRDVLFGCFSDSEPEEARYLARLVLGEMRIGVGEGAVRDGVAEAFEAPEARVARALQVTNDCGLVAERARDGGADALADLHLEVGRPVQAMLAQAGTVADALAAWDAAVVETKLDGARVQVHVREDGDWPDRGDGAPTGDAPSTTDSTRSTLGAGTNSRREAKVGEAASEDDPGDGPAVRLFSRNMEDVTAALPEVVESVADRCEPPAILDGEVLAVDDDGEVLPFQEVLRRFRRKHDVEDAREAVATELHVFDCLHAPAELEDEVEVPEPASGDDSDEDLENATDDAREPGDEPSDEASDDTPDAQAGLGAFAADSGDAAEEETTEPDTRPAEQSADGAHSGVRPDDEGGLDLLDAPLRERRAYLEALLDDGVVASTVTDDAEAIEAREQAALEAGHEGIVLKNPESAYTPSERGKDWLKRKPDVETLDLVVTGAEWGEGRRASLFGTYQVSARTDDGYARIGNVATGLTDEELEDLHERFADLVEREDGQTVELEPSVVFEVGYEEIQRSPTYDSGYALRFPRFVAVRDDLDPSGADGLERVERLADD